MGMFIGDYKLRSVGPTLFAYTPDASNPFRYVTDDGRTIQPIVMLTDGASVPRIFWSLKWFAPCDWIDAAIIHDGMYEEHHLGLRQWSFTTANLVMLEAMKAVGVPWLQRHLAFVAVQLFGWWVWNRYEGDA